MLISEMTAKTLVFANAVLDFFAVSNGTTTVPGISGCDDIVVQNVSLTACGAGIADAMGQLVAIGLVELNAILQGSLVIQGPTI
jgi:hypothetical protein